MIYESQNGDIQTNVIVFDDTVLLSQKAMSKLFNVDVTTINYHQKEIFSSGELDKERTIRNYPIVQAQGNRNIERNISHCNW